MKKTKKKVKPKYDHLVLQFRPNTDIKSKAQELVDKLNSVKGGHETRLSSEYKNNNFHQVVEVKEKDGWHIFCELIKRHE